MNHHISQVHIVSFQVNFDNNDLPLASGGEPEMKPEKENLIDALYHKVADKWKVIGVLLEFQREHSHALQTSINVIHATAFLRC